MADTLLRDAIAEAKQVKAAAIANARLQLEEAFTPHLNAMLARGLRNEMEDHTKSDAHGTEDGGETDVKAVMDAINPSSSDIGSNDNTEPSADARKSSNIPNPKQEVEPMGKGSSGADPKIGGKDPAPEGEDAHPETLHESDPELNIDVDDDEEDQGFEDPSMGGPEMGGVPGMGGGPDIGGEPEMGNEPEMGMDMGMGGNGEGDGDELDLEAIIRELEKDVLGLESPGMDAPMGAPEEGMGMGMATEDKSAGADKTPQDTTLPMGKGNAAPAPEGSGSDILKLSEEEVDLEEILREMDVEDQGKNPQHYAKREETLQTEIANLKRSLKEHRDVVRFLKDRITEINMLNAKLLFTNKLFKQYNLNPGQKMQIVETFDRATTLREVKLIFTTLAETIAGKNTTPPKTVRQITEGLASKVVGSTKPKSTQALNEGVDEQVARFKKLAGILKS